MMTCIIFDMTAIEFICNMHKAVLEEKFSEDEKVSEIISPLKITIPYLAFGLIYIFFSDYIIAFLFKDPDNLHAVQSMKGAVFIIVTSSLLYFLVKKHAGILTNYYETLIYRIRLSEKELKQSEENYFTMFDESPLSMWIYDKESLKFKLVNNAAVNKYGYSKEEFYEMTIKDIRPADDLGLLYASINERGDEKHKVWPNVFRHQDKSGNQIFVRIESVIVPFNDKVSIMVSALDVTQDLNNQEKLLEVNNKLTSASELAGLGYWSSEKPFSLAYCSEIMLKICGIEPNSNPSIRMLMDIVHKDDKPMVLSSLKQLYQNGGEMKLEHRITQESGEIKWVRQKLKMVANRNGCANKIEGIVYDISERKNAEEVAQKNKERYIMLSRTVFEAIIDWDYSTNELYLSEGFTKLFGYDCNAFSKNPWFENIYPEDKNRVLSNFKASLSNISHYEFFDEYRFVKSDGDIAFVQHRGIFDRDENGRVIRALGAIIDITESVRKTNMIKSQNQKLSNIIWTQSHILRSPVASILGLVDILKDKSKYKDRDEVQILEMLDRSAKKLDEVIHDITYEANTEF